MRKQTKNLYIILSVLLVLTAVAGGLYWGLNSDLIFNHKTKEELLMDVAWYSEGAEEFTITTVEELYDIAALSEYYTFEGQTIKLGADIVVNEGNAEDWAKKAPERKWWPIRNFAGTFDGEGHTISGLYGYGADYVMGLFSNTKPKSIIKNFELRNTYFKSSGEKVGAISSNGAGTFEKIYTNAIVETDASKGTGGFIGKIDAAGESAVVGYYTRFTECWFDGEVRLLGNHGLNGGGFVGIFSSGTLEIKQCLSSGKISSETSSASHTGGFIGDTKVDIGNNFLNMDGCLSDVELTAVNVNSCGATVGYLRKNCTAEFANCYATIESWHLDAVRADASFTGNVIRFTEKMLSGYGGYQWTSLDFDKYWSVTTDSTPILQTFADEVPSLEGIAKAYDISWYDKYTDEFVLDTKEKFYGLFILPYTQAVTFRGQTIKLACDVTMNTGKASKWDTEVPDYNWIPIGSWTTKFEGIFDGQGHTVSGIYSTGQNYVGLFGVLGQGSSVKNLKLVNSYFSGYNNVGGVIGRTLGDIESVYSDAIIVSTGGYTGGIVGQSLEPYDVTVKLSIKNCWFAGKVYVKTDKFAYAGGIIGDNRNNHVSISHCLFTGSIYSESTRHNPAIGGIIGTGETDAAITIIDDCFSAGTLEAPLSEYKGFMGSIAGSLNKNSKITNSYATTESWEKAICYIADKISKVGQFPKEQLSGIGGYQWTTLDFNKYWTVVENGTPVLKSFAKKGPSVAGVPRMIDISWYDESKKEYILDSAADLLGFSMLAVSNNFEGKTVKLGADITINEGDASTWGEHAPAYPMTPITNWGSRFAGTFDGQGHTISGVYVKAQTYAGLFGVTDKDSVVKNFRLVNSYIEGEQIVGSIVGRSLGDIQKVYSDATVVSTKNMAGGIVGQSSDPKDAVISLSIENCWYDGNLYMTNKTFSYAGGILGLNQNNKINISHCLFTGEIHSECNRNNVYVGGIIGTTVQESATTYVKDCFSAGTLTAPNSPVKNLMGSLVGQTINSKSKVTDSYATIECWEKATSYIAEKKSKVGQFGKEQLTGIGGYQWTTLDFDNHWAVVENGTPILKCFATNVPSVAGVKRMIDISWYDESKKEYVLDSEADLMGFSMLATSNNFAGKTVKLGADITINEGDASTWGENAPAYPMTPITDWNSRFTGTFDGQGHTISGVYVKAQTYAGLFGVTDKDSVVKNFRLVNSYIEGEQIVGSIVGRCLGNIQKVYSDATVVSIKNMAGGIVGQSSDPKDTVISLSIENCWYDGNLYMTNNTFSYAGGILGLNQNNKVNITHCLFTGEIHSECNRNNVYVGGIIGTTVQETATTYVKDCFSAGTLTAPNSPVKNLMGSLVGQTINSKSKVTDSYATIECWEKATSYIAEKKSKVGQFAKEQLSGIGGYQWTTLDFNNHWAVVENGTPILKCFATNVPSVAGVKRMIDISWYDESKKEYVLDSEADLMGFSMLATSNNFAGKTVKLGADITINDGDASTWGENAPAYPMTPITDWNSRFAGIFDGQGYTISGVYVKAQTYAGLFGVTDKDSVVMNFKLVNSYIEGEQIVGSIVGRSLGNVQNVYSDATVVSTKNMAGGIVGQSSEPSDVAITLSIENCWYNGKLYMKNNTFSYAGGILGLNQNNKVSISHCLFTGQIHSECNRNNVYVGGMIGTTVQEGAATYVDDCLSAGTITAPNSPVKNLMGSLVGHTEDSNSKVTDSYATTECWSAATHYIASQKSVEGQLPEAYLKGANGYAYTTLDFDENWVAIANGIPELKAFSTGKPANISKVGRLDTSWYDGEDTTFVLSTEEELLGFSVLAKDYSFEGKIIQLGADVVMDEGVDWMPIGSATVPFKGTFDGEDPNTHKIHSISKLYTNLSQENVGLFGYTDNAIVRNIKLFDSSFTGSKYVGAVVGYNSNSTVDTVYVEANVTSKTGGRVGGVVGRLEGGLVNNCAFDGTVELKASEQYTGGLVGQVGWYAEQPAAPIISNCLVKGVVKSGRTSGNAYVGGLLGGASSLNVTIKGCVSIVESVTASGTNDCVGWFVGGNSNAAVTTTNCYAVTTGNVNGIGASGGSYVGAACNIADSTGASLYMTKLDFDTYWVLKEEAPELKSFASNAKTFDARSWYDDATADANGNEPGTKQNPYVINEAYELYNLAEIVNTGEDNFANKYIVLGKDIVINSGDSSKWSTSAPAYNFVPIGIDTATGFRGHFNDIGKIREIKGLYINQGTSNFGGLFGSAINATIANIKVTEGYVQGGQFIAAVAGYTRNTTIDTVYTNVYVRGTIATGSTNTGGIIGYQDAGTVSKCWVAGTVEGTGDTQYVGGVVGRVTDTNGAVIDNCLATGKLISGRTTNISNNAYAGGILGGATKTATISNCFSAVTQVSTAGATGCVGSVLGGTTVSGVTITNCYAAKESCNGVGLGTGGAGTPTGTPTILDKYTGYQCYKNVALDYEKTWVAMETTAPRLRAFAPETGRFDTDSWYVDATTDKNGNAPGTKKNPYIIDHIAEMYGLAKRVNAGNTFEDKYIKLGADLTFNTDTDYTKEGYVAEYEWTPIGVRSTDGDSNARAFKGSFNVGGDMHEIRGLYSKLSQESVGLFGYIHSANIQNIKVVDSYLEGTKYVATIAGYSRDSMIDSVYANATVTATTAGRAGGIAGRLKGGTINQCWANCKVSVTVATQYAGGIVGQVGLYNMPKKDSVISNCLAEGTIYVGHSTGYNAYAGGILGGASSLTVTITNCLSAVDSVTTAGATGCVGSFVGGSSGTVVTTTDSYVIQGISSKVNGTGGSGSYTGEVQALAKEDFYGTEAYKYFNSSVWAARDGKIPIPAVFAPVEQK